MSFLRCGAFYVRQGRATVDLVLISLISQFLSRPPARVQSTDLSWQLCAAYRSRRPALPFPKSGHGRDDVPGRDCAAKRSFAARRGKSEFTRKTAIRLPTMKNDSFWRTSGGRWTQHQMQDCVGRTFLLALRQSGSRRLRRSDRIWFRWPGCRADRVKAPRISEAWNRDAADRRAPHGRRRLPPLDLSA